ncbi:FadR/GntR family transcriptional regulator [Streptomyces albipurpureus]|uniref:FadR family transcriptional regulator n=1 Tax=Streptomyces albipurpureus TaxID=2897419 RepID=A0ABT0UER4_9ACTN|nr:FadR/GntR family transcriptional regulator [Streptomyces sp. CWNU-1]MCM2386823.1 FadR family transcriptional regulator [Streptomyces sp. CWNU-1]
MPGTDATGPDRSTRTAEATDAGTGHHPEGPGKAVASDDSPPHRKNPSRRDAQHTHVEDPGIEAPSTTADARGTTRRGTGARAKAARTAPAVDLRPLRPLAVRPLSDRVADQIREFIVNEDLAEDTRLPAERDLAVRFGTSRPTVSQALRTLSLMGLVEIRPGSGAYVVHRPDRVMTATVGLMLDLDRQSIPHLAQLRLWLETVGVQEAISALHSPSSAVEPGPDAGLADIRTAFERLRESAGNVSAWIAADTVFHATIVRRSGNPFLASIYESVHTAVIRYEYEPWIRSQTMPPWLAPGEAERLIAVHEPIMEAIEATDSSAALVAVRHHHDTMMANIRTR